MSVKTHLEAAAAYIAVAEAGDAKRAAYEKAADEIIAAQAEDPKLTQTQIAVAIGKSQTWTYGLLKWRSDPHAGQTPWAAYQDDHRYRSAERKVPTRHEDRVEMAEKLLADPKVAKAAVKAVMENPSRARRVIDHVVHEQNAEERRKQRERAEQRRQDEALPLPAYMARMVTQMSEWSLGLAGLYDDLDELPEGRARELVAEAAAELARQAQRWVDRLDRRPDLQVIEGQAKMA